MVSNNPNFMYLERNLCEGHPTKALDRADIAR